MADTLTTQQRSERMSRIRGKDTGPEWQVRKLVHGMGYRYRLHASDLPGRPDLVFRNRGKVMFVHGCFWHSHEDCKLARVPKSRRDFWVPKLAANKKRDARAIRALRATGWKVLVIWECQLSKKTVLRRRIQRFLEN
jgi:DNA mismatch endonuclease, patch repair protein